MKTWTTVSWIALAVASQACFAQTPNAPMSGTPVAGQPAGDAAFVRKAFQINTTELELSKMARNDATNPVVIKFSTQMVRDLSQSNRDLQNIAEKRGIAIPTSLDAEHAALVRKLTMERGSDLHMEYAEDMTMLDQQAIPLYQAEAADSNPDVAAFAQRQLPTLEASEKVAQQITASAGTHRIG